MYSCDVLFFDALNEAIRREIERDGKTIYEKARS
ncbi:nucleotidyltransferase [Geobacillus thermoleovorans]|nr:nucleotidyltransferase [Geobacillus thermoleovorans]